MTTLIWVTVAYVVLTKYFDCWTTVRFVRTSEAETNAFARCLMRHFGFVRTLDTFHTVHNAGAIAREDVAVGKQL